MPTSLLQASALTKPKNIFNGILSIAPTSSHMLDELQHYLALDVEDVTDALKWWYERRGLFPCLSRMARDYLSIPSEQCLLISVQGAKSLVPVATTVDVERVFSHGRLVLPHVHGRLAVQSTHASLCIGLWSSQGFVKEADVQAALDTREVEDEDELPMDWDAICVP